VTDADRTLPAGRRPGRFGLLLLAVGAVAAVIGAYVDWLWWPVYSGLMLTLVALALLVVGGIVAIIPRRAIRRAGLVTLAVAVGLLLGQNLGPSREPLIQQFDGTITLRLDTPVPATASGPVSCSNVASETEFYVSGDPNLRLDSDRSFVSIQVDKGDRWEVLRSRPSTDGVWLLIAITPELVTDKGIQTVGMESAPDSTIDATFANDGGRIRFAGLAPATGTDYTGDAIDLSGTIEWTCGPPVS